MEKDDYIMTIFTDNQINKAVAYADLMNKLGSKINETEDEHIERVEKFIKKVNRIEDKKGLKVVNLESEVSEIEMSDGELRGYNKDGELTILIPKGGNKCVLHGTKLDNNNLHEDSIKKLEKKRNKLLNHRDIINYTYGGNVSMLDEYEPLIRNIDGLSYCIDILKNSL